VTPPRRSVDRRINPVTPEQWRPVADTLAAAFFDDPVLGWLLPTSARRAGALQRLFAVEARDVVLRHGVSFAAIDPAGVLGAALILPPGHWRTPIHVEARHAIDYARIFGHRIGHALGVLTVLERAHPRYPHYYLPFIGVTPAKHGQGIGGAILSTMLRRCDAEHLPAYLEASSPDNARLYRRHGFLTIRQMQPLGAPRIELMVRRPQR
jgi:GNAT superfamily N-acetyltransferase